jgi:hypothetical protein
MTWSHILILMFVISHKSQLFGLNSILMGWKQENKPCVCVSYNYKNYKIMTCFLFFQLKNWMLKAPSQNMKASLSIYFWGFYVTLLLGLEKNSDLGISLSCLLITHCFKFNCTFSIHMFSLLFITKILLLPICLTSTFLQYYVTILERHIKKSYPRNRPWRPTGLWDVKDPTLSR